MNKMKITKGLLMILWLTLTMCSNPTLEEPDYLVLSEEGRIEIDNTSVRKIIDVEASKSNWTFVKSGDWLTVKQNSNQLLLEAGENKDSNPRISEILVISGRISKKIEIVQFSGQSNFTLSSEEAKIIHLGGDFSISVVSSAKSWEATTNVKWLTLTPEYQTGTLHVSVDENDDYESREAKIYFSSGDFGEKEFSVIQTGKIYLLLPTFDFLTDNHSIREFEFARGSQLFTAPDGVFNKSAWNFYVASDVIRRINYTIYKPDANSPKEYYKSAAIYPFNPNLFGNKRELDNCKRFLVSNGFAPTDNDLRFVNWAKEVEAVIFTDNDNSRVKFTYMPEETEKFKTLTAIPKSTYNINDKDQMIDWESKNNGVLNDVMSDLAPNKSVHLYWYDVQNGGNLVARYYFVNKSSGAVDFISLLYDNKNIALFYYKGTDFPTHNFINLMHKEGFEYRGEYQYNTFEFYNSTLKIRMFARYVKFKNFSIPTLELQFQLL